MDDATSDWKTYNGSSGDLTGGLIPAFQGFGAGNWRDWKFYYKRLTLQQARGLLGRISNEEYQASLILLSFLGLM